MSWLSSMLAQNSIFVLLDWRESLEKGIPKDAIVEIGKYYQFAPFALDKKGRVPAGKCFLSVNSARHDIVEKYIPQLLEDSIPLTLFLEPQYLGTNRLSFAEEVGLYVEDNQELLDHYWHDVEGARGELSRLRAAAGQFPIERVAPGQLYSTWGRLKTLNPEKVSFGLRMDFPWDKRKFLLEQQFIVQQLGQGPRVAYAERPVAAPVLDFPFLTTQVGAIERRTPLSELPQWQL